MPAKRTMVGFVGAILAGTTLPSLADVHLGHNVRIGGHDFSHQTYDRRHRAVVTLYDRPIHGAGCVTRGDGHGGSIKRCRLQTIKH